MKRMLTLGALMTLPLFAAEPPAAARNPALLQPTPRPCNRR